jgi:glycosyltransferase involved in cell wall biosynthesis
MTKIYDYVFVTHLPAFYKINLYNKLAERLSILVIFISGSSTIRTQDFVQAQCAFPHIIVNERPFELRPKFKSCVKFIKILKQLQFKKIILGGWDLPEFWMAWGMLPKEKLAMAVESSIHESTITGPKFWLKKIFVTKMSIAYVSGIFQKTLVEQLNVNQVTVVTGGVGLINPPIIQDEASEGIKEFKGRFLYLGRLSEEKNIALLIHLFGQKLKAYHLTIVGKGPLEDALQAEIKNNNMNNISIQVHVPNSKINELFSCHDVLILPSRHEPWGLVVEEGLAYGLPVIVSDKVGCYPELVKDKVNGYVFKLYNNDLEKSALQLTQACIWVAQNYESLVENIAQYPMFNWSRREQKQVAAYLTQS